MKIIKIFQIINYLLRSSLQQKVPLTILYDPNKNPDILDVVLPKSTSLVINQEPLFELHSDHLPVTITIGASLTHIESTRILITGMFSRLE